jgi:streptomycin 6-kinase
MLPFPIPDGLQWLRGTEAGSAWLDQLGKAVEALARRWDLALGTPFSYAFESLALPATRADGTSVVLKIPFVDRENEHEPDALRAWNGDGAIGLLAFDAQYRALLLERAMPGTSLATELPATALDVLIDLVRRLSIPVGAPFRPLAGEARWWSEQIPLEWERTGRLFERRLVDAALEAIEVLLPRAQEGAVLIHQDLHPGNVLRADRQPWLAIDAKPVVGERAFSAVPIVRSFELGNERVDVEWRLARLSDELDLDRERVRLWSLAEIVAWDMDSKFAVVREKTARWLVDLAA